MTADGDGAALPPLPRVDYDGRQHTVYAKGRTLPRRTIAEWTAAFERRAPARRPLTVLDLGSGIGRFTPGLADAFGGPVYGVEPSAGMRAAAVRDAAHPGVTYLEGSAERVPLPDASCDLVLMFLVWQHLTDEARAAREIARVLRPGGVLLVRGVFTDRMPDLLWYRYFPRARELELRIFPTTADVTGVCETAGLRLLGVDSVRHRIAADLAGYAERLRHRAISTFEHLTEEETAEGFARLDADVAASAGGPEEQRALEQYGDLMALVRR